MAMHFALAKHPGADDHEDMMWFFQLKHDTPCELARQLSRLLEHPKRFIKKQGVHPQFTPGPIVLVFEYGPFTDAWYVHGVEKTNVVSIRCPPLSGIDPRAEKSVGTNIHVVYLQDPLIAFAHFDPKEAGITLEVAGHMIANPTRFPTLLNAQTQTVYAAPESGTSGEGDGPPAPEFTQAKFVLSPNFRFRYEARVLETTDEETESVSCSADDPAPLQCVKFGGVYSAGNDGTILIQIDEAWSMIWQEELHPGT